MNRTMNLGIFTGYTFVLVVAAFVLFLIVHWFKVPAGQVADWIVGTVSIWWLVAITTVPWDLFFTARATLADIEESKAKSIFVEPTKIAYIQKLSGVTFLLAVSLHLISAAVAFSLSYFHVTEIGYYSSGAAILLTFLRPAVSAYEYLWSRLRNIQIEVCYPRNDINKLITKVDEYVRLVSTFDQRIKDSDQDIENLRMDHGLTKARVKDLDEKIEKTLSKLQEDTKFVGNLTELVSYFKKV